MFLKYGITSKCSLIQKKFVEREPRNEKICKLKMHELLLLYSYLSTNIHVWLKIYSVFICVSLKVSNIIIKNRAFQNLMVKINFVYQTLIRNSNTINNKKITILSTNKEIISFVLNQPVSL